MIHNQMTFLFIIFMLAFIQREKKETGKANSHLIFPNYYFQMNLPFEYSSFLSPFPVSLGIVLNFTGLLSSVTPLAISSG